MMNWCLIATIFTGWMATRIGGVRVGSYNTYQIFSNPIADDLIPNQIGSIMQSGVDVMCLQELFSGYTTKAYVDELSPVYPYSFSRVDIQPPSDYALPRDPAVAPCSPEQSAALMNDCPACTALYPDSTFGPCIAAYCPNVWEKVYLTECVWCYIFASTLTGSDDINVANGFCGSPQGHNFNGTDGTLIVSKLPILNTWSVPLPSFLFVEKRLNIAQIGLCSEAPCAESLIVACAHLNPTGYIDPVASFVAGNDLPGMTSHVELNAYQIQSVLQYMSRWDSPDEGILGIIIAGDLNTGQSADAYPDNFNLFTQAGYIDYGDGICTYCAKPQDPDFNVLALGEGNANEQVFRKNKSEDLDHVLVRGDGLHNFQTVTGAANFEIIFTEKFDINGQYIPLSDHYGVQLDLEPKVSAVESCGALDIDYFLGECSSLWDPLPDISVAKFNGVTSCPALDIDRFLSTCSDRFASATSTVNANVNSLSKLSEFDAAPTYLDDESGSYKPASCEALEIGKFLSECSDIYTYIDDKFRELSHPNEGASTAEAQAAGGIMDVFGDTNTVWGFDENVFLIMSLIANCILVIIGCCMANTLRKYRLYHKPEIYAQSSEEL